MKIVNLILALFLITNLFSQESSINQLSFSTDASFVENKGQFDRRGWVDSDVIQFGVKQGSVFIFFTNEGVTYRFEDYKKMHIDGDLDSQTIRKNLSELINVKFLGSNPDVKIIAEEKSTHYNSYGVKDYKTGDVSNISYIKGFKKITYKNLYDNIDIEYTFHPDGGIKYNVVLRPGANPSVVKMQYETKNKNTSSESEITLNKEGKLQVFTSLGVITEHKPLTFYDATAQEIVSKYLFEKNVLTFELENYDTTKKVIIDPWVISPAFNAGDFTREVETDITGNIYTIGGELPMVLRKYSSVGALIWQYNTPWDTINGDWLGTLATNEAGVSFITQGTGSEIERVSTAGMMDWHQSYTPGGLSTEFWSITFNCDDTKLIVGGTGSVGFLGFRAVIYDIDPTTGIVNGDVTVNTGTAGFGTPVEVRSISSSKNAKYIFLTHLDVGAINQNIGACPTDEPVFKTPNVSLGYKCENFLSANQNGGGLKAIIANDNFFYVHNGDEIKQYNVSTGTLVNTVVLPGGSANNGFGGVVVHCSGLDVDVNGNVYAGSMDRVVMFDENLNVLNSISTTGGFTVYDVSVSSNGEVIAGGAILDNGTASNRGAKIEALNFSTGGKFAVICCDANICPSGPFCDTDLSEGLIPNTIGGTWSGNGVDASGDFDPAVAGVGTHVVTYTLACGFDEISIVVSPCTPLEVCEEANGDLTASLGDGNYTWFTGVIGNSTTPINSEADCIACVAATPEYVFGFYTGCDLSDCAIMDTSWTQYSTGGTTVAPSAYPILITDGAGLSVIINNQAELAPCSANPCNGVIISMSVLSQDDPNCSGGNDGTAIVDATGGAIPYSYTWTPGGVNGATQNSLSAGTYVVNIVDNLGCVGSGSVTLSDPSELIASAVSTPEACGLSDGTATGSAIGGTGIYSYSWAPSGGNLAVATGMSAGQYTVTVVDGNMCTSDAIIDVNSTGGPVVSVDNTIDVSCFGLSDGEATVSTEGGSNPYTYSWAPGALSGSTQNSLAAGQYTVTVSDAGGCTDAITFDIIEPLELVLSTSNIIDANCGASDGAATVDAVGGDGNYSYVWTPNVSSTATATNVLGGAYIVDVTDGVGCTATINFTISTLGGPNITVLNSTDVTCFEGSDGEIEIEVTGGSMPYTYSWAPSGGSSSIASGLVADDYTVTLTDDQGCVSSQAITIAEPNEIILTGIIIDEDCGETNGAISLSVSGGNPSFTYSWSPNGETSSSISNLVNGNYNVIVTDNLGCTANGSYYVQSVGGLTVTASPVVSTISEGENVQITVSGADTYTWSPVETLDCFSCDNPTASPSETTIYTVVGTDANGCSGTFTVTVFVEVESDILYIPNIVSLSSEEGNNLWYIQSKGLEKFNCIILNRWGNLIYEYDDPDGVWDGKTTGGKLVNEGTYYYIVEATGVNGESFKKHGFIQVFH